MFFKRKKTKQEQFLDELYWDSIILKEMIDSYKKDRKLLLSLLRDRVRHTKPVTDYDWQISNAKFEDLSLTWYWSGGSCIVIATYKGNNIPDDIAEDLYKLYRIVWCGDTEVRL